MKASLWDVGQWARGLVFRRFRECLVMCSETFLLGVLFGRFAAQDCGQMAAVFLVCVVSALPFIVDFRRWQLTHRG